MKLVLRDLRLGRLGPVNAAVPAGAVIGVVGEAGSGQIELLRLVTRPGGPVSRTLDGASTTLYAGPLDEITGLAGAGAGTVASLCYCLDPLDAFSRAKAARAIDAGRRSGLTVFRRSTPGGPGRPGRCTDPIPFLPGIEVAHVGSDLPRPRYADVSPRRRAG